MPGMNGMGPRGCGPGSGWQRGGCVPGLGPTKQYCGQGYGRQGLGQRAGRRQSGWGGQGYGRTRFFAADEQSAQARDTYTRQAMHEERAMLLARLADIDASIGALSKAEAAQGSPEA